MHRQPSLFGVGATDPAPADLAGLLAGPGRLGRMGGTARVSVVVDAAWRVHALVAELVRRGLTASWQPAEPGWFLVRSAYSTRLAPLAYAWSADGGGKRPPTPLHLGGHALRLWVAGAGAPSVAPPADQGRASHPPASPSVPSHPAGPPSRPRAGPGRDDGDTPPDGYELRLGAEDRACWPAVGAALAAVGLAADLARPKGRPPAYVITGRRRLERLVELVGPPPAAAPPGIWPAAPAQG